MTAARVIETFRARGATLAVAESLTGGLLAARLVDVSGASAVLRGGVVAYATDLKVGLLGVDADLLDRRGPVDPEVATSMAAGVRVRLAADVGAATTGVAGPGAQGGCPAGTFFVAVSLAGGDEVEEHHVDGDRPEVRAAAVEAALALLLRVTG
ncbi:CinA family protein [Sanguibacter suaedae]|uniref:CinA family protein n=1 Tax=Sanguibacter suaedae TaxID=2795737 RepID=A0A934MBN6_9MICO|nr:CinA family protein [Sanguibacter suaedae]MBI9115511.1 CinA family protein [Sanguibacter suaedae]